MLIMRILVFFFALSLISAFFVSYSNNPVLLTVYNETNTQINTIYSTFSNAMQSLSQGSGVLDILGFMSWGVYGAVLGFVSVPSIVATFTNETIAILGFTNPFITALINVVAIATSIYVFLFILEVVRPGTTGVSQL